MEWVASSLWRRGKLLRYHLVWTMWTIQLYDRQSADLADLLSRGGKNLVFNSYLKGRRYYYE